MFAKMFSFNFSKFVQLFRILHFNQQFHMIFAYLVKIIKQNKRISTFQKLYKSIHCRNNFENSKITSLSNLCLLKCVAFDSRQCLQRFNAISIITQCALDRFSILLIIWIEFISNFKTNFRLYILFIEYKCY